MHSYRSFRKASAVSPTSTPPHSLKVSRYRRKGGSDLANDAAVLSHVPAFTGDVAPADIILRKKGTVFDDGDLTCYDSRSEALGFDHQAASLCMRGTCRPQITSMSAAI